MTKLYLEKVKSELEWYRAYGSYINFTNEK